MNFRLIAGTVLAMLAFAGNSVLCRMALEHGAIDPASFTSIRLFSGAIMLSMLLLIFPKSLNSFDGLTALHARKVESVVPFSQLRRLCSLQQSNWLGGFSLFAYAAGFSFAYISLPAGTGALILFATVQITMLSYALLQGARFSPAQWLGFAFALFGLTYLFLPGISAPPLFGAVLMMLAGCAWGIYSLLGKKVNNPTQSTAENFIRASLISVLLSVFFSIHLSISFEGFMLAIASGALTSGMGYAIWYSVLPHLKAASSATLQLTVPVIATVGGVIWLGEDIGVRLIVASIAILSGVAMVVLLPKKA